MALCYSAHCQSAGLFLGSSAVERSTVNRNVAGSIPARGANLFRIQSTVPSKVPLEYGSVHPLHALVRHGTRRRRNSFQPEVAVFRRPPFPAVDFRDLTV